MRDQYAGDVSDLLKFGFLRALAGIDRTLGVAWYYAPGDDGGPDGRHLEWRDEAAWRHVDADLHAGLSTLPTRSIAALEQAAIWPNGALFHREPMPPRAERNVWGKRKREALDAADIVFLDPDNGVGAGSPKHATFAEVRLLRKPGRAVVFITFPSKGKKHDEQLHQLHERLRAETGASEIATLRTNVSVPRGDGSAYVVQRQRWFTVVDYSAELIARAQAFVLAVSTVPRVRARLDV
ncbi:hypothetical protein [Rhizobium sp. RAF56]|uniref:hypothetical protein n=1 Tax=Rhizobium sp. RAF56 TaxID=3233062 RepID=UPI003F9D4358